MSSKEMAVAGPEVEVVAKASRRRFTVEYKRKIVREADGCKTAGAVGALLRREGLYSSHLTTWRAAQERGELAGQARRRGPPRDPLTRGTSGSRSWNGRLTGGGSARSAPKPSSNSKKTVGHGVGRPTCWARNSRCGYAEGHPGSRGRPLHGDVANP